MRLGCKCNYMPFFYLFLLAIIAGVTLADKYYYKYSFWYVQGASMAAMVVITLAVFGCGRVRQSKREVLSESDLQLREEELKTSLQVVVVRDGYQTTISKEQLTVGDKLMLQTGEVAPCDCLVYQANSATELIVNECPIRGEKIVRKKSVGFYN